MKKLILTILVLATGLTLGLPLQAATLKIATITPEGSQWMKDMRAGAKEIKERTEGRVQIKYYGGGVMGSDQKVLSRIRIGSLQGGAFTPTALTNQYSGLDLYGLPMMFDSAEWEPPWAAPPMPKRSVNAKARMTRARSGRRFLELELCFIGKILFIRLMGWLLGQARGGSPR